MNEELTMLPVADIYPHPDNPRKDVGDVTELADSVKKRGILQNLTVMPGHWTTESGVMRAIPPLSDIEERQQPSRPV